MKNEGPSQRGGAVSRRSFLKGAGGVAAGGLIVRGAEGGTAIQESPARVSGMIDIEISVNGETRKVRAEPRTTLLSVLRHRIEPALTGTKLVCGEGSCGACTVLLDGEPVYSCMLLALDARGRSIRTIEGESTRNADSREVELSTVQRAFCEEDASMCGFCTSGFVMSVTAALERDPNASEEDVRVACSGNLCRCGTQPHVFRAALSAGRRMRGEDGR